MASAAGGHNVRTRQIEFIHCSSIQMDVIRRLDPFTYWSGRLWIEDLWAFPAGRPPTAGGR